MKHMKNIFRKMLSPSTVTFILSGAIMVSVISCIIASAPKPAFSESETPFPDTELTRIEAPDTEVDTYAYSLLSPVTVGSQKFDSPEIEAETMTEATAEPETIAAAESEAVEPELPETEPVTPEPEVTTEEMISKTEPEIEVSVPETTAPETAAPETEPVIETTAPVEPEISAPDVDTSWADKYNVKYTIVKPDFGVTEYEIKLAAAVIQLEVMGGGSTVDAFEDTTEKYDEMLSVAEVIRNRVDSSRFPDTVEEVIRQKIGGVCQFSPVEQLEKTLENGKVTEGAIAAAREALITGVMVKPNTLCYFCATYTKDSFEKNNAAALVPDGNGSFVQWEGHLTTFYAGNIK